MTDLPVHRVAHVADAPVVRWGRVRPAVMLVDATDGRPPRLATAVRVAHDGRAFHVRFDCVDPDPWSTFTRRDDPLWEQEAVELFLAPGPDDPMRYVEFEVSPRAVLFDAVVDNPEGERSSMRVDPSWGSPEVRARAGRGRFRGTHGWWAELTVPWAAVLDVLGGGPPPATWRANLYRIDRPRDGSAAEFTSWSPTGRSPANFHVPARFGVWRVAPAGGRR